MSYSSSSRMLLSSQREGQTARFRAWVLLLIPLLAIGFQIYVPLFFPFAHFLEMPLLVVIYFALVRRSQISGLLVGAAVGLAQDSLSIKTPLGMYGIDAFTPIINLPQCAILGVGRIVREPTVVDGQIVAREQMTLSLTFDHRVVDGAPAARFLNDLRQAIEHPAAWLVP